MCLIKGLLCVGLILLLHTRLINTQRYKEIKFVQKRHLKNFDHDPQKMKQNNVAAQPAKSVEALTLSEALLRHLFNNTDLHQSGSSNMPDNCMAMNLQSTPAPMYQYQEHNECTQPSHTQHTTPTTTCYTTQHTTHGLLCPTIPQHVQQPHSCDKILEMYKKLAMDFQAIQQSLAANNTHKPPQCAKNLHLTKNGHVIEHPVQKWEDMMKCTTPLTGLLMIMENIHRRDGNFTRITLIKRKITEKKKDIDVPSFTSIDALTRRE